MLDSVVGRTVLSRSDSTSQEMGVYDGSWYYFGYVLSINVWSHIVFVSSGTNVALYIDGIFIANTSANLKVITNSDITKIGLAEGEFRNARLYNTEIIQQEITDIYNYEKNFRAIDIDDGLVAYYPLKNNSLDNYYDEFDGSDLGVTYDGNSAVFNGTSFIDLEYDLVLSAQSGLTLSVWAKASIDENMRVVYLIDDTETSFHYITFVGSGALYSSGSISSTCASYNNDVVDNWIHLVYTFHSEAGGDFYVNNILAKHANVVNGITHNLKCRIGSDIFGNYSISGNISNFRIYDKALTKEQINVIYNTEKGEFE